MSVWKRYNKYYYTNFYIKLNGKRKRIVRKVPGGITNKETAQLWENDLKLKLLKCEIGLYKEDTDLLELKESYLNYSKNNKAPRTYIRDSQALHAFFKISEIKKLSELTPTAIERYKVTRRKTGIGGRKPPGKTTINLEITMVKALLNWGIDQGNISDNPIKKVKKICGPATKTIEFLTKDEIITLLEASTPTYRPIIFVYLKTGLRKGELIHLEWSDIDFSRKQIRVINKVSYHIKRYKERFVPMDNQLVKVLRSIPRTKSNYVFTTKKGTLRENNIFRELQRTAKKAGIQKHVTIHVLRHTYASQLVMAGVDLRTVQVLLGHTDIKTTMQYAHLSPDHLKQAVEKLDFF
jgi:integrase